MVYKKYYCNICDKYVLNEYSHNKTKLHTQLLSSVVNKYYNVDVSVIAIDNIINKHIRDYKQKFREFDCWCIIQNISFTEKYKIVGTHVPEIIKIQEKIIRRYNCNHNDLVYIEIIFITNLESATYNHHFHLPKPMIERKICQIIDRNPNLIKTLDNMPEPYKRHIIIKHWGIRHEHNGKIICVTVPYNWMNLEPNHIFNI